MCVYFSRIKTAQCLPTAFRKRHMAHRSFVVYPCCLSLLRFLPLLQLCTLWSGHTELLLVHQMPHTLCFSPGSVLCTDFPLWPEHALCPIPPALPKLPLLIFVQITPSGQLSLTPPAPFRGLAPCSYSTWHFTYNGNYLIIL